MANRFWVGGNANWDATAGTKWATTSGGAGGAAVPTAADDVFLDNGAGTGNVTIPASTTVTCRSLNCTGYIKTLTFAATTSNITIGDATAGASNVALLFVSGMTLTLTGVGTITLQSTSATQQTVTGGGKTLPNITVNGTGSSYIAGDALVGSSSASFTLTAGTWDNGGFNSSYGFWVISGSTARTWKMSASALTVTGVGGGSGWLATTTTNLTAADLASSGSITLSGNGGNLGTANFFGGGLTYNSVSITGAGISTLQGTNTFATLTISMGAQPYCETRISNNQTITGTLTLNGNSASNRCCVRSNTIGTQRTLTAATLSSNGNVDLMDIVAAGASSPWTNTSWGVLNVSNITGATPVTTYWVGGTGNSNDATKYASSSGGTANTQRAPLLQDTAIYDANSGVGTLTINTYRVGSMNFSNCALTGVTLGGAFLSRYVAGNLTFNPSVALNCVGFADVVTFCSTSTQTLTLAGSTLALHSYQVNALGTCQLGSSLTANVAWTVLAGTFTTNNYAVSVLNWSQSGGTANMGASVINLTATTAISIWSITGGTFNAGTSTIVTAASVTTNQTFAGGGKTYYNLFVGSGSGNFTITGANTFNAIEQITTGTRPFIFPASTTTTISSHSFISGTSGNVPTIVSSTSGTAATISFSKQTNTNYVSVKDITASGAGSWYAGANSTNVSGNTGVNFTVPPDYSKFAVAIK